MPSYLITPWCSVQANKSRLSPVSQSAVSENNHGRVLALQCFSEKEFFHLSWRTEAHVKTNNLFKVTEYLDWNWTHSFLCIPPTLLTGSTARRPYQHTSLTDKALSLQLRLWKPPLCIIPFMQEYMRKVHQPSVSYLASRLRRLNQ